MAARAATFLEFAKLCRVELTPGQRVIAAVAFDGVQPRDLRGDDRDLARRIFGDVDTVSGSARAVFVAVCGARSGKSYVLISLRSLHLALTVPGGHLASGEHGFALIVAPDLKLAHQDIRFISGLCNSVPAIKAALVSDNAESVTLDRGGGRYATIEALAASRGGSSIRGRSLFSAALDEAAFFRDSNYVVNDEELYKAVAPRIVPGGQLIVASTAWAEAGLLYEQYRDNWSKPKTSLVAYAPTVLVRNEKHIHEMVERETIRDPDNAAREFGAQFMSAGTGTFFDDHTIDGAVDESIVLGAPPMPGATVTHGADFGFVRDSSACATAHRYPDRVILADVQERKPEPGIPLKPSTVCSDLGKHMRRHGGDVVMADDHYKEAVREFLLEEGLSLVSAPAGLAGNSDTYVAVRSMMREGKVKIPKHPRLLAQLRDVRCRAMPGGGLSIFTVRRTSGHGDLVSAAILALYQHYGHHIAPPKPPRTDQDDLDDYWKGLHEELSDEDDWV